MSFTLKTGSAEETAVFGRKLGRLAVPGLIVTLSGDLGAGKTAMTKGIADGLDVPRPEYVTSPTFTIHKVYQGRLTLNHLDFYRLGGEAELEDLGLEDTLGGDGVSVIEWPDNFYPALGTDRLDIRIKVEGETERGLAVTWSGPTASKVGEALALDFVNSAEG